jgi:hypothetical protein
LRLREPPVFGRSSLTPRRKVAKNRKETLQKRSSEQPLHSNSRQLRLLRLLARQEEPTYLNV